MANRMDITLLLPDLASQYATSSHSVSLRLLAYALQAFPLAEPFAPSPSRSETENLNILRIWADMLVARGENSAAASIWKQVAVWCHHRDDLRGGYLCPDAGTRSTIASDSSGGGFRDRSTAD